MGGEIAYEKIHFNGKKNSYQCPKKNRGVKVEITVLLSLKESFYVAELFGERLVYYARSLQATMTNSRGNLQESFTTDVVYSH